MLRHQSVLLFCSRPTGESARFRLPVLPFMEVFFSAKHRSSSRLKTPKKTTEKSKSRCFCFFFGRTATKINRKRSKLVHGMQITRWNKPNRPLLLRDWNERPTIPVPSHRSVSFIHIKMLETTSKRNIGERFSNRKFQKRGKKIITQHILMSSSRKISERSGRKCGNKSI